MKPFFSTTREAMAQMTALFDFVWPTAAALWNLRWQVKGFIAEAPSATTEELKKRFLFGSGIEGVDLKRTVQDQTWDGQQSKFASFILTNTFAVYEQWADELLVLLGEPQRSGKKLQFPDRPGKPGLQSCIGNLTVNESATIKTAFYPALSSSAKYDLARMQNLLSCYRYFKELRNAQVHMGGVAGTELVNAFIAFKPASSKADLGLNGELVYDPVILGQTTCLHLRGVVGFTDVLFRLIVTIDAELSRSSKAEEALKSALKATTGTIMLSAEPKRRDAKIRGFCRTANLPPPADPAIVHKFMLTQGLVRT